MKTQKKFWQSKTVWGFGLALIIAFAQANGVVSDQNMTAEIGKLLTTILGVWGARNAVMK